MCEQTTSDMPCHSDFPKIWPAVAKRLFDPTNGWFAPVNLCGVIFYTFFLIILYSITYNYNLYIEAGAEVGIEILLKWIDT